jgi:hypothetical protein
MPHQEAVSTQTMGGEFGYIESPQKLAQPVTREQVFHKLHEGGYPNLTDAQSDLMNYYTGVGVATFDANQSAVVDLVAYTKNPGDFLQWNFENALWHEFKTQALQDAWIEANTPVDPNIVTRDVPVAPPTSLIELPGPAAAITPEGEVDTQSLLAAQAVSGNIIEEVFTKLGMPNVTIEEVFESIEIETPEGIIQKVLTPQAKFYQDLLFDQLGERHRQAQRVQQASQFLETMTQRKFEFGQNLRLAQVEDELGNLRPLNEAEFDERMRQFDEGQSQQFNMFQQQEATTQQGQMLGLLGQTFPSILQAQMRLLTDPGAAAVSHLLGGGQTPQALRPLLGNIGERIRGLMPPTGTSGPVRQLAPGEVYDQTYDPAIERQLALEGRQPEQKKPAAFEPFKFAFPGGSPNVQQFASLLPSERQALEGITSFLGLPPALVAKSIQQTSPGGFGNQIPQLPGVTR